MSSSWLAGQIEQWPIGKLVPYARNARTHSPAQIAQIAASIAEFGFTNPILVGSDGGIVAGHGRLAGALALGLTTVPVIVLGHLNPAQRRALVIADNRLALDAEWDEEMLARELTALQEDEGFDLSLLGFSDQELAELLAGLEGTSEGLTDEDATPEVQDAPVTVVGNVWLLGDHRLMCDDSTSIDAVKKLMAGQQADMLLCDPPYNVCYGGAGGNAANKNKVDGGKRNTQTILNDDMSDELFRQFLVAAFTTATTVMKPGAVFYIWHSDTEGYNFRGACRDAGLTVRQCLLIFP
jgi:hypothetical protein